jgi:hypothetical protein
MQLLKTAIRKLLRKFGFEIFRLPLWDSLDNHLIRVLQEHNIDTVLDIGANEGQFVRNLRNLGFRGRIVSFEPNPACLPFLQALAAEDSNLEICSYALGDRETELELIVTDSSVLASFLQVNKFALDTWEKGTR